MIGPRVRERRLALKMRQNTFIQEIAIATKGRWAPSRVDVTRIEQAFRSVTDSELVAIAAVLRCEPNWLLVGDLPALDGLRKTLLAWQEQQPTDDGNEDRKSGNDLKAVS